MTNGADAPEPATAGGGRALPRAGLAAITLLYVALSLLYQRATPPLEASDEGGHVAYVLWLQQEHRLPRADPASPDPRMTQEFTQPPLYYLPGLVLVRSVDTANWRDFFLKRPGAPVGRADLPGPKNIWETRGERAFPYRKTRLAIALLRVYSLVLGIGTILVTARLGRRAAPGDPLVPVLAAALVAFNPMFLFISNSVNNDNLVTLLVPLTLLVALSAEARLLRGVPAAALGLLTGCALLAKLSAGILLPAIAGYTISLPGALRQKTRALAFWLGTTGAVCGWWFMRARLIYGDWTGFRAHAALAGNLRPRPAPLALVREWDGFIKSYWGVFGGFNVIFPDAVYYAFYAVTAAGLSAFVWFLVRKRLQPGRVIWTLAAASVCNLLALGFWTSRLYGSQGRLLFPSLAALSVLSAVSLTAWRPDCRYLAAVLLPLFLLVVALYGALVIIPAQYG